jgi:hypothetical protein
LMQLNEMVSGPDSRQKQRDRMQHAYFLAFGKYEM